MPRRLELMTLAASALVGLALLPDAGAQPATTPANKNRQPGQTKHPRKSAKHDHGYDQRKAFDDFATNMSNWSATHESVLCEKAAHSKAFDRWVRLIETNKLAEAKETWKGVLAQVKGVSDLGPLVNYAVGRFSFSEAEIETAREKELPLYLKEMFDTTLALEGENTPHIGSLCRFPARCYEGMGKFDRALRYREIEYRVFKKFSSLVDLPRAENYRMLTRDLMRAGKLDRAEIICKEGLQYMKGTENEQRVKQFESMLFSIRRHKQKTATRKTNPAENR